jgi:enamine deaminase RidA (YjgF/YER057c/UK114 family)
MKFLQPPNWPRPKGYANGVAARGSMVFLSGVVGWNAQGQFVARDFPSQVRQALRNIVEILGEAKAKPEIGAAYREIIGRHYPAMTVVEVSGLVEADARVEIEVTAMVPD